VFDLRVVWAFEVWVRVYKFVSSHHGIENLQKGRLKISTISSLNDPFEFSGAKLATYDLRRRFERFRTDLDGKVGIISFARNWHNPVVWAHYAENHKGIAIGFNFEIPDGVTGDQRLFKVEYGSTRLAANLNAESEGLDATLQRLSLYKFKHWSYESEYRMFVPLEGAVSDGGLYFEPFKVNDLWPVEILLGPNYESRRLIELEKAFSGSGISVRSTRLAFKAFKVVLQEKKALHKGL
jgi:Protein of unknown function (DUF2971)